MSLSRSGAMNGQGWASEIHRASIWSSTPGSNGGHDGHYGVYPNTEGDVGWGIDTYIIYVTCVR